MNSQAQPYTRILERVLPWLSLGGVLSSLGAISAAWPQLRDRYHRLSSSYREIAVSGKG